MPDNLNKSDVILEVKDLKMRFGKLEVLRGVNTTVRRGEVIVVIGASGAGKSTFLRCLNRLETPTDGDILFEGESVVHAGRNLNTLRERMGMVFQQFNLFNNLNVLDNITLAPSHASRRRTRPSPRRRRAPSCAASAWRTRRRPIPRSSPAGSASASPSCARSRCTRTSCSLTSPPPPWTPRWSARCSTSCSSSPPTA